MASIQYLFLAIVSKSICNVVDLLDSLLKMGHESLFSIQCLSFSICDSFICDTKFLFKIHPNLIQCLDPIRDFFRIFSFSLCYKIPNHSNITLNFFLPHCFYHVFLIDTIIHDLSLVLPMLIHFLNCILLILMHLLLQSMDNLILFSHRLITFLFIFK